MTKPYFSDSFAPITLNKAPEGLLTMTAFALVAAPTPNALIHTLKTATECMDTLVTVARVITAEQTHDGHVTTTPLLNLVYETLLSSYDDLTLEELRNVVESNQELDPDEFKKVMSDLILGKHNEKRGTNYAEPGELAEKVFSDIFK